MAKIVNFVLCVLYHNKKMGEMYPYAKCIAIELIIKSQVTCLKNVYI